MTLSGYLVTSDNERIHYDLYRSGHAEVIIVALGFFNSKEAVLLKGLRESLSHAYDVMVFDFRGHGSSSGLFHWTSKEYLDLLAVIEFASINYKTIGLIGFSMGAATGIIAASKTDLIDSIISVSAPSEFSKIDYHFWKLNIKNDIVYNIFGDGKQGKGVRPGPFWLKKESPIEAVKKIQAPIFYIHGDKDWVIQDSHSKELFRNTVALKRLSIIRGGPHAEYLLKEHSHEIMPLILEWFQETLGKIKGV